MSSDEASERLITAFAILLGMTIGGAAIFAAGAGLIALGGWFLRLAGLLSF